MTRAALASAVLLATSSLAWAGAERMPRAPQPPQPPDPPSWEAAVAPVAPVDPVRVVVAPGDDDRVVFVAKGSDGGKHELKVVSKDGRIVIEGEPDPDRPWLGILLDADEDGIEVTGVMEGSPAAAAGLEKGDVITKIDGRAVTGDGRLLEGRKPGERINVTVDRDGAEKKLGVTLGAYPGRMEFDAAEGMAPFAIAGDLLGGLHALEPLKSLKGLPGFQWLGDGDSKGFAFAWGSRKPRLGVEVERLSDQLAEYFGTEAGKGLLVMGVREGMPAAVAGLKAGDVLLEVDGDAIAEPGDILEALDDVKKGDTVQVEVLRRGERRTFTVELDSDPQSDEQSFMASPNDHFLMLRSPGDPGDLEGILGPEEAARLREKIEMAQARVRSIDADKLRKEVEAAHERVAALDVDKLRREIEAAQAQAGRERSAATREELAAAQRALEAARAEMDAQRRSMRGLAVAPTVGRSL